MIQVVYPGWRITPRSDGHKARQGRNDSPGSEAVRTGRSASARAGACAPCLEKVRADAGTTVSPLIWWEWTCGRCLGSSSAARLAQRALPPPQIRRAARPSPGTLESSAAFRRALAGETGGKPRFPRVLESGAQPMDRRFTPDTRARGRTGDRGRGPPGMVRPKLSAPVAVEFFRAG